ncbi:MAG: hypothetical protein DDG58_10965 [Ardenticatenia bacterium]|nr:MAG: hypothetical protein DDG58_10965 [Ardenticatenia bacterium]
MIDSRPSIAQLKHLLTSIQLFSRLVLQRPLYPYQLAAADAVVQSCLGQQGREFLLVFPRQSGKDETIAQLTAFLLTLFQRTEARIVHVYPTRQQLAIGTARLLPYVHHPLAAGRAWSKSDPPRIGIGTASCTFFSGHPKARCEGATANLLLIINEAQDQDEAIVERRFTPMRASTNATALYAGTVRTTSDYLWRTKTRLERLEAADGIRRVFLVTPDQVRPSNPAYGAFVDEQVRLKGRQHPSVKSELFCEPIDTFTGLFPPRRIALMTGTHARQRMPTPGTTYLATLDVAGQDEAATDGQIKRPARDYTVCTVFQVSLGPLGPIYHAVDALIDQGSRHFQSAPGMPALLDRLVAYLNMWQPLALIADASGVGQGLCDALARAWPRQMVPVHFTAARKSALGNAFIALVETGRFQYWTPDDPDGWMFYEQCRLCTYEIQEGIPPERGMRWYVPPHATTTRPDGAHVPVHDDQLMSAALVAEADRLYRQGKLFLGGCTSEVLRLSHRERAGWT